MSVNELFCHNYDLSGNEEPVVICHPPTLQLSASSLHYVICNAMTITMYSNIAQFLQINFGTEIT